MKRIIYSLLLTLTLTIFTFAQDQKFSDPNVEYTFDLPETMWKMVAKPSATSPNVEYAYGDRLDGHFEIRKVNIKNNELVSDLILRDQEQKLQFLPGFVAGKEEPFAGTFKGRAFNYEFVRFGKNMSGRFYYLKANDSTVYIIRFTGLKDKLRLIRNQTDAIARSFELKK
jgi:hypothetical protein